MSMSGNWGMSIEEMERMTVFEYYVSYEAFIRLKDAEKEAMEKANK